MSNFNQYGSNNQQIGTQNNTNYYYNSEENTFNIFIDIDFLRQFKWHNFCNVYNSKHKTNNFLLLQKPYTIKLLKSIIDFRYQYIKDNNITINIETSTLTKLENKYKKLQQKNTASVSTTKTLVKDITCEHKKIKQIKILLKIIALEILDFENYEPESTYTILNILCNLCIYNDDDIISKIYPWKKSLFAFSDEYGKIFNFVNTIKQHEQLHKCFENDIILDWEKDNKFEYKMKSEFEEAKTLFIKSLQNSDYQLQHENKLQEEAENFIHSFDRDKYKLWHSLPFCFTINLSNGYKFSIFNFSFQKEGQARGNYNNLFFQRNKNNILSEYFSRMIYVANYKIDTKIEDLNFHKFFKPFIKSIDIEFDPLQKELRRIHSKYLSNYEIYIDLERESYHGDDFKKFLELEYEYISFPSRI